MTLPLLSIFCSCHHFKKIRYFEPGGFHEGKIIEIVKSQVQNFV